MKRIITLATLLLSGVILASCRPINKPSSNGQDNVQHTTSQNPELADYLSKHETIIYDLENSTSISKDTRIEYLLVVNNGKITTYDLSGPSGSERLTIGDMSKLSDKEVIEKANEYHKQNLENYYKEILKGVQTQLKITQEEIDEYKDNLSKYPEGSVGIANGSIEEHEEAVEKYKKLISALENTKELKEISKHSSGEYSINLTTDGSGNQTSYEYIQYTARLFSDKIKNIELDSPLKSYFPMTDNNAFGVNRFYTTDIYDSIFNIGVNNDGENTIAIRTDKNTIYKLDSPKTKVKNVTVDAD